MKKPQIYFSALLCLSFLLLGCDRENDINRLPLANLRNIESFVLNPYSNPGNVSMKFTATIDENNKLIRLKLPKNTRLDSIRPAILVSPWASVSPMNLELVDLTKDTVEYTVTAESGKKSVYSVVKDMTYLYANNAIYSISVLNQVTNEPVLSFFWSTSTAMKVPVGTDKKSVNVNLVMAGDSYNSTITVSEDGLVGNKRTFRPFSNPVNFTKKVVFLSISEDGKKITEYTITGLYN